MMNSKNYYKKNYIKFYKFCCRCDEIDKLTIYQKLKHDYNWNVW